ncbi:hypothetical protein CH254_25615 [Rhodococcus sp. 06-412-2C]|nr:hypothetical protein CH254_25615 [Rhodococcus sp. 06-412-2C]OZC96011.1 hypothetical protein CH279_16465 [Rhodococcus sp. 06-412-2B]
MSSHPLDSDFLAADGGTLSSIETAINNAFDPISTGVTARTNRTESNRRDWQGISLADFGYQLYLFD